MSLPWHLYIMALLYLIAGLNHFINPGIYLKIIPLYLPNPKPINLISGASEVILGFLLMIPGSPNYAAWGIIVLLTAVFPANLFIFKTKKPALTSQNGFYYCACLYKQYLFGGHINIHLTSNHL